MMTMSRLIDADELVAELIYLYEDRGWHEREIHFSLADIRCNVDMMPTVDAVEVVRCKDCIHRMDDKTCEYKDYRVVAQDDDDYCSWGERRENDLL